jgi:large subunit ribosomal protein L21
MSYAIISLGGKQYRVREGERLLVDRLPQDEGKTFHPPLLLLGGDGDADLQPKGVTVTARVVKHVLGEKVRIGKYRPKTGYRRHTGYRSRLSQIEIEAIGAKKTKPKAEAAEGGSKPAEKKAAPRKPKATKAKETE